MNKYIPRRKIVHTIKKTHLSYDIHGYDVNNLTSVVDINESKSIFLKQRKIISCVT